MAGIPARRSSLPGKAQRAAGAYAIGAPATTSTTTPAPPPASSDDDPRSEQQNLTLVPSTTDTTAPQLSTSTPLLDVELTRAALLATPRETVNISLDKTMDNLLHRSRIELRKQGYRASLGTLVSHALATAYEHYDQWLAEVEPDARRSRTADAVDTPKRRTSMILPSGLAVAAELLVWKLAGNDAAVIPSIVGLQMVALRWGLQHQEMWLPELIATT